MNSLVQVILLQMVVVGVIIAEIFIPSGGLLAALAIGVLGYSLYQVFTEVSVMAGYVFIAADVVLLPVLIIFGLKMLAISPMTLRKKLSREEGVTSQAPELAEYLGKEGVTLSVLRPGGTARINGRRVDVVSRGEYVEKDTAVVVWKVTGNQIIVRKKE